MLFERERRTRNACEFRGRASFKMIIRAAIAQPRLLSANADVCQPAIEHSGHVARGKSHLRGMARRQGGRCQSCRAWRSAWPALLPAWHLQPSSQMPSLDPLLLSPPPFWYSQPPEGITKCIVGARSHANVRASTLHFLKSHRKRHRKLLESQEYSVVRLLLRVTPAFVMHLLSVDAGTAAKL